jgi:hypothetical protein
MQAVRASATMTRAVTASINTAIRRKIGRVSSSMSALRTDLATNDADPHEDT